MREGVVIMQYTTYKSPLPLSIFFSGERSTLVSVKHKSSHQIFHFCGLVVEFFQCSVSCYSTWGSFGITFVSFFSIFGFVIRKIYPLRIECFSSLNFTLNRLAHKIEQRLFWSLTLCYFVVIFREVLVFYPIWASCLRYCRQKIISIGDKYVDPTSLYRSVL